MFTKPARLIAEDQCLCNASRLQEWQHQGLDADQPWMAEHCARYDPLPSTLNKAGYAVRRAWSSVPRAKSARGGTLWAFFDQDGWKNKVTRHMLCLLNKARRWPSKGRVCAGP